MKNFSITLLLFIFSNIAFAQTGPAGIGDNSSNILWLRSNDIKGLSTGDSVTSWVDTSGNSNDFSQPVDSFTPEYQGNIVNGHPVVRFNKTNGRLRKTGFTTFPTTAISAIFVNRNNGETGDATLSYATSSHNNEFLLFRSNAINIYRKTLIETTGTLINDNNWHIVNASWTSNGGNVQMWKDGDLDYTGTGFSAGIPILAGGCLAIAGEQDAVDGNYAASQAHFGDFTEVILYDTVLNVAQNAIMANYLAAKYGQTLAEYDLYDEDDAGNGDYDFEVAGIGQASDGSNHTDAIGTGMVGMSNPAGLDNNEFLIWGHDNGVPEATETSDIPGSVQARLDRVWKASEADSSGTTVDVGAIDIRFNLTGLGSVTPSHLRLLVDTDNDGQFSDETPISGATSLGGNVYEFAGVTAIADNRRFTLATTNIAVTPVPVDLISYEATILNNGRVKLHWKTAAEINNDFFTIERSTNGENWITITKKEGSKNSISLKQYIAYDNEPLAGNNFYRLSQTDYDGKVTYYKTKKINITTDNIEHVTIYPNPTQGSITVTGNCEELSNIKIYNSKGTDVTQFVQIIESKDTEMIFDLTTLSSGVYYFNTTSETHKIHRK